MTDIQIVRDEYKKIIEAKLSHLVFIPGVRVEIDIDKYRTLQKSEIRIIISCTKCECAKLCLIFVFDKNHASYTFYDILSNIPSLSELQHQYHIQKDYSDPNFFECDSLIEDIKYNVYAHAYYKHHVTQKYLYNKNIIWLLKRTERLLNEQRPEK